MKVSVCIATYNGEKYILKQINSILPQLDSDDEVIILDDCSTDNTVDILRGIKDDRIKIFNNDKNMSHVFSFGKAISLANNDVIFMSDQDDIWLPGRLKLMKETLVKEGALLISTNSEYIDNSDKEINFPIKGLKENTSKEHW